jgi:hypothetical protein
LPLDRAANVARLLQNNQVGPARPALPKEQPLFRRSVEQQENFVNQSSCWF